jgi:DsbC/DsbD-like thiol-disulfide interchange protein
MRIMIAVLALAAGSAQAQGIGTSSKAEISLLAGWGEADGGRLAGLSITLEPGWKTYWRTPGETGIPPTFDWSESRNVGAVEVIWPAPTVFLTYGFSTLGYKNHVTLPLRVKPVDPDAPISLRLGFDYGVCEEICIAEHADVALDIAPGAAAESGPQIAEYLARAPMGAVEAGVVTAACAVRGAGAERRFDARMTFDPPLTRTPMVVVEGPANMWFGPSDTAVEGADLTATAEVQVYGEAPWIGRDSLRMTVLAENEAIDIRGCGAAIN